MSKISTKELLELHHLTKSDATHMKLLVKCKFCGDEMIKHTPNETNWCLTYLSEGKTYEDIYG